MDKNIISFINYIQRLYYVYCFKIVIKDVVVINYEIIKYFFRIE